MPELTPPTPAADPRAVAFSSARASADRAAFTRYLADSGVAPNDACGKFLARSAFDRLPLLLNPLVRDIALAALRQAVGPPVTTTTWTMWTSIYETQGGAQMWAPWSFFCHWHVVMTGETWPKPQGRVFSPVATRDLCRRNASVTAIHAAALDCDGVGRWDPVTAAPSRRT